MSVTNVNSTLERDGASEPDTVKYILVIVVPVSLALAITVALGFLIRACWRKWQGSKEYRRVPTKDIPDHPKDERVKRKVRIIMPDPPPIKTSIAIATDLTKSSSMLSRYLPHNSPATSDSSGGEVPTGIGGVAAPQAFLYLKLCMHHNRVMVEVHNAVGLPCRTDGTPVNPFVKLRMVSRENKHRKSSSTHSVPIDPEFLQRVDCGSVTREELENSILHIEVLDHWPYTQDVVIAVADLTLDQVREKLTKSFKVPLNIVKLGGHPALTFNGHALISLYNDKASSKLSVTIPKVELLVDSLPSTDYWMKVVITRGEKCLVKEKVKHVSILSDEIHFNKSVVCHNISDITSLSVQCSLVTMATVNFMRRPKVLGTVTLGSHVQGQALRHWNDMMNTPNTPIAEWHDLT